MTHKKHGENKYFINDNTDLQESIQNRFIQIDCGTINSVKSQEIQYKYLMISLTKQDFKTRCPNTNSHVVSTAFCIDSSISCYLTFSL